jgi:serine/threonine-protein kinase
LACEDAGRVNDRAELLRTFGERVSQLGIADTAVAVALDATQRPGGEPSTRAWTRPDPGDLPRISLSFALASVPPSHPDERTRADLEVHGVIGEGGMGVVHAARQRSLDREVALKTLKSRSAGDGPTGALLREAIITGRLEHPNIVPVHALGLDENGAPVLVMKRVEGVEWRALLADPRHAAWQSRPGDRLESHLEILMQVCQAVHFAHDHGVIHCDIKLENVMLGTYGEVYLVDWGIAVRSDDPSMVERSGLVGTPAYMPPELVSGGRIGAWTDVYLLGATLHHVVTGSFRHEGDKLQDALMSAFLSEPVSYGAEVPEELAALCNRATARAPDARLTTALDFRNALADFLRHKSSITLADEASERLARLESLLDECAADTPPEDLRRAYQLVSECRFGFAQALKEWNENAQARSGLSRTVLRAIDLELRQGHVQVAEALLAELGDAPPEVKELVRLARKDLARSLAEDQRLRALAREQDSSVAVRERTKGLAAMTGAAVALSAFALSQPNPAKIKPEGLLAFAVVVLTATLLVTALWRKRLFANQFSRRMTALMVLSSLLLLASRSFGVWMRMPAPLIFTQDLLVFSAIAGVSSVLLLPWLAPLALLMLGGAAYCLASPGLSPVVFSVIGVLTPPSVALALWRHRAVEEQEREDSLPQSTTFD